RAEAPRVLLLTGQKGEGKTTLCAQVAELMRARGRRVAGVLSPGFWDDGARAGYRVLDLLTGRSQSLAGRAAQPGHVRQGSYWFDPSALQFGRRALAEGAAAGPDLVIVDEVGPLELGGGGWAPELDLLHAYPPCPMLWVVRPGLIEDVKRRWPLLEGAAVIRAAGATPGQLVELLLAEPVSSSGP
ncbi:MAG: nucleoside-triphosphatase, partial [Bryobacteraceae bacterium]